MSKIFPLLILVALFIVSCEDETKQTSVSLAKIELESVSPKVTTKEIFLLEDIVEDMFYSGNIGYANNFINAKAFYNRGVIAIGGTDISEEQKKLLLKQIQYMPLFYEVQNNFTRYDWVKNYVNEDGYNISVFRGLGPSGLNYHEFLLGRVNNKPAILDVYIAISGEYLSESMMELTQAVANKNETYTEEIFKRVNKFFNYISLNKYNKALKIYNELPGEVQQTNIIKTQLLLGAASESIDAYEEQYKIFLKGDPDPVTVLLQKMQHAVLENDTKSTTELLKDLLVHYPKDSYLHEALALIYQENGECKLARESYKKVLELEDSTKEVIQAIFAQVMKLELQCGNRTYAFDIALGLINDDYFTRSDFTSYVISTYPDYLTWPEAEEFRVKFYY